MEIRVTRPFIVSIIPGDQYGDPGGFIIILTCNVLLKIIKSTCLYFVLEL